MLYILDNGVVKLTRGDSASFEVKIFLDSGEEYCIGDNDELRFTLRKNVRSSEFLLQKVLVGWNRFKLEPEDTSNLSFGSYKYDVELTTEDGDIYTVIEPTTFKILSEVTY